MKRFRPSFRITAIILTLLRFVLNRQVIPRRFRLLYRLSYLNPFSYRHLPERGEALRRTFEALGPIFIKLGQMLSMRSDIIAADVAQALTALQDNVTPFPSALAISTINSAFGKSVDTVFAEFDPTPLASASVAQVHTATLHSGESVVIKIVRPGIRRTIRRDLALMYRAARRIDRYTRVGKTVGFSALVAEFEHTIYNELDMQREGANASTLRRHFHDSKQLYVPRIYWDYTHPNILVMERIHAVPINQLTHERYPTVNFKQLAANGVEIFFTQVLRDRFFHADMHPGNLFVDISQPEHPRYIGVDFGIMGALSPTDQRYIGENLLAFFQRDYYRVAALHIESGWVPEHTRVDQLEAAVRAVAEPIFERPIGDISFAHLLLKLLEVAQTFSMKAQPQLMLLQKTLMGVEALGRKLYPELDLWATAKPFLENWLSAQKHPKQFIKELKVHWQPNLNALLTLPTKLDQFLSRPNSSPAPTSSRHGLSLWSLLSTTGFSLTAAQAYFAIHPATLPITALVSLAFAIIDLTQRRSRR